jgi:chromate transport protein ChrA
VAQAGVYGGRATTANPWIAIALLAAFATALLATRIPAVARVLAAALHVVSLRRLRAATRTARTALPVAG